MSFILDVSSCHAHFVLFLHELDGWKGKARKEMYRDYSAVIVIDVLELGTGRGEWTRGMKCGDWFD